MNNESPTRAQVWSRYWSQGIAHSCGGSYADGYGSVISTFWQSAFSKLKDGARILDIGTGNGPLPRIMLSLNAHSDLQCDAVDMAEIAPSWFNALSPEQRRRVRFHSNCVAEDLPFEANQFDLAVSQWGFEYSDLTRSVPELLRVIKPGGAIQLLLHHSDALPVTLAAQEIGHLDWLLGASPYLDVVRRMLTPIEQAQTPAGRELLKQDAKANQLRAEFNALQDDIQLRIDRDPCPDVLLEVRQAIGNIFALVSQQGRDAAELALENLRQELLDSRLRLLELRAHAMTETTAKDLAEALGKGASYELCTLRDKDTIMGWGLTLTP